MPTFREIASATWTLYWRSQLPGILLVAALFWISRQPAVILFEARWFFQLSQLTSMAGISLEATYYLYRVFLYAVAGLLGFAIFASVFARLVHGSNNVFPVSWSPYNGEMTARKVVGLSWYLYWRFMLLSLVAGFLGGFVSGLVTGVAKAMLGPSAAILPLIRGGGVLVFGLAGSFWALSMVLRRSVNRPIGRKALMLDGRLPAARLQDVAYQP